MSKRTIADRGGHGRVAYARILQFKAAVHRGMRRANARAAVGRSGGRGACADGAGRSRAVVVARRLICDGLTLRRAMLSESAVSDANVTVSGWCCLVDASDSVPFSRTSVFALSRDLEAPF